MTLSSGAKRELLVIYFVDAVFRVALEKEAEGTIPRDRTDNKLHKINKRIDRRIMALRDRFHHTANIATDHDVAIWLHGKTKHKVLAALSKVTQYNIQLETFGLYLMYANFCERDKPLDPIFAEYNDPNLYFDEIDLMKMTNITEDDEAVAMNVAYTILKDLKG